MIGGIFETIGKTLGVGQEKYFLELDDAAEDSVKNIKESATKAAQKTVTAAQETSSDVAEKAPAAASTVTEKVEDAGATVKQATKQAKNASPKAAVKGTKEKASKATTDTTSSPKPVAAQPAVPSTEDLIIAAIANAGKTTDSEGKVIDSAQNFSTDYLMPIGNRGRRRPGPSLGNFKGMAKEVNPRLR